MADENENSHSDIKQKFSPSFDNEGIPACLEWTPEDVAEWIEYLGFPQYKVIWFFGFFYSCQRSSKDHSLFFFNSVVSQII